MLTSQLYGDQPTQEEKIQKSYDEWKANKDTTARIQERYNSWLEERKKSQQVEQPSKTLEVTNTEATLVPETTSKVKKKTQADVLGGTNKSSEKTGTSKKSEQKKYLTHTDAMARLTKSSVDATRALEKAVKLNNGFIDRLCNGLSLSEEYKQIIRDARQELSETRNIQVIKPCK
mgnify:CR=1 FL=1